MYIGISIPACQHHVRLLCVGSISIRNVLPLMLVLTIFRPCFIIVHSYTQIAFLVTDMGFVSDLIQRVRVYVTQHYTAN
jgi:hypothetical protein